MRDKCFERIDITNFKEKFLFVKIHNILPEIDKGEYNPDLVFAATFGFWRLNLDRCSEADYVLALNKGVVCGVFHVKKSDWKRVSNCSSSELAKIQEIRSLVDSEMFPLGNFRLMKKHVVFLSHDTKTNDSIKKQLLFKEIYYGFNEKLIKSQNIHYSMNFGPKKRKK